MSQNTADELLISLGFVPVARNDVQSAMYAALTTPTQRPNNEQPASKRRRLLIGFMSALLLGTGFKMLGDYAADCAIDAWAVRAGAPFGVAPPESIQFYEMFQNQDDAPDDLATNSTIKPIAVNYGPSVNN